MATAPQLVTPRVNHITRQIIAAAMKVHSALGPGLLESAYHACLLYELRKQGLTVASQVGLPVVYDGEKMDLGYRIDLIVNDLVIVEIKCMEAQPGSPCTGTLLHAPERETSRLAHQLLRGTFARRD